MLVKPVIAVGVIVFVNAIIWTVPAAFADTTMMPGDGPFFGLAVIVAPGLVKSASGVPPAVVTVTPTGAPQAAGPPFPLPGTAAARAATQAAFAPPKAGWAQGGFPGPFTAIAQSVAFTPVNTAPAGLVPGFPTKNLPGPPKRRASSFE